MRQPMLDYQEINIEFDTASREYYIIWQPMAVISSGKTEQEALEDLRETAHFGINTLIDLKLKNNS